MSAQSQDDNGPFIIESLFSEVVAEVEAKYGSIDESRARRMLFLVMNDNSSNGFQTALSRAKTIVHVPEIERARYHSFGVRYFQRTSSKKPKIKPVSVETKNWEHIKKLCLLEQPQRREEAGEDRLSPDWEPPYKDTVW